MINEKKNMSKILSERKVQPGHDRVGHKKEKTNAQQFPALPTNCEWGGKKIIHINKTSIIPDETVTYKGKLIACFSFKNQGKRGNAHERLNKYLSYGVLKKLKELHCIPVPIFYLTGALATEAYYENEISSLIAPKFWEKYFILEGKNEEKLNKLLIDHIKKIEKKGV